MQKNKIQIMNGVRISGRNDYGKVKVYVPQTGESVMAHHTDELNEKSAAVLVDRKIHKLGETTPDGDKYGVNEDGELYPSFSNKEIGDEVEVYFASPLTEKMIAAVKEAAEINALFSPSLSKDARD